MLDLCMAAAQRAGRVRTARDPCKSGNQLRLFRPLVGKQRGVEVGEQLPNLLEVGNLLEVVGHVAHSFHQRQRLPMVRGEAGQDLGIGVGDAARAAWPQQADPQSPHDGHQVDPFLQNGARRRGQQAHGRETHRDEAQSHPDPGGLRGSAAGAPGDPDRLAEAVDPVHREDHIGGLGGRGGTTCRQGHPDAGRR